MDRRQRPRRCIGLARVNRGGDDTQRTGQRTGDLETLFVVVLDGAVSYRFVEEIDKGEDELLFRHDRASSTLCLLKQSTTTPLVTDHVFLQHLWRATAGPRRVRKVGSRL